MKEEIIGLISRHLLEISSLKLTIRSLTMLNELKEEDLNRMLDQIDECNKKVERLKEILKQM